MARLPDFEGVERWSMSSGIFALPTIFVPLRRGHLITSPNRACRPSAAGRSFSGSGEIVQLRRRAVLRRGIERRARGMRLMEPHSTSLTGAVPSSEVAAARGILLGGKQVPFLATKVVAPRRPGLIDRPRLLEIASRLPAKRLVLIKAPAGFGKTSLAATWCEWLRQGRTAVAWLAIDADDDEPARFLFYLTQAMQRAVPGVGADALDLINETFLINLQAVVSVLVNELGDFDDAAQL